jgi:hypothetical protein
MILTLLFLIIIIIIILFIINKYLSNSKENFISLPFLDNINNTNKSYSNLNNMYLFICCDNNATIKIQGKFNDKTFNQSGYNTLGSYFLENILENDEITINVTNNGGNGGVCVSYIWDKQLYILDENGFNNNANIIKYTATGNNGWSTSIASNIDHILPWMKNWITMNNSMTLSFKIGNNQNSSALSNDMIVFLGIDDQGTVKLNGNQVYSKDKAWNEISNFIIPNVNNGDKLTIDCVNLGGPGGISLTYLWQGYVYAFPSTMEGLNSTINIINYTSTNTTSFIYCDYVSSYGYSKNCDFMTGGIMFNRGNWLRSCDGNCNFTFNTTISNNIKNSWIYDKTINTWYKTVQNNLIGKWSDIDINSSTYMSVSFFLNLEDTNFSFLTIFDLTNNNSNNLVTGNMVPYLVLLPNKIIMMHSTTKTVLNMEFNVPSGKQSYITLTFNYNTIKVYLNGTIIENKLYPDPLASASPDASFYISDPWGPAGALIKDFTIYNYVLSDNEIKYLYNNLNNILLNDKIESEIINSTPVYSQEISLTNASIYLPLTSNTNNIGTGKAATTVYGPVIITNYGNKQCAIFNNSLSTYLTVPFSNSDYLNITFGYWIYPIDGGYYDPASIGNTNMNQTEVFQTDISGGNSISMIAHLPNYWTVNQAYNVNYLNKWTHVVYTCSQVSPYLVQMYINGNLVRSQNGSGSFINIPNIFIIGRSGDQGRAYNGYIREFFAFNSVLNSSDIKSIYNSTT